MHQLIGASLENEPQNGIQPGQRPLLAQRGGQRFIQALAFGCHAPHNLGEQRLVGFAVNIPVDLAAQPMMYELADHRLRAELRVELELI